MADKKLNDIKPDWKTDWHAAFYDAVKVELRDYKDSLDIRPEVPLTDKPQRMDVLIAKKTKEVVIERSFAKDFKALNIIEYKSPEDSFTIPDFYKMLGYASNLSYLSDPTVTSHDMTVTIVVTQRPVKLFKFLQDSGMEVATDEEGFYRLKTIFPAPDIKVVENKLLDKDTYPWLSNLSGNVSAEVISKLMLESESIGVSTRSYFHALAQANPDAIKEVRKMDSAMLDKVLDEMGYVSKETHFEEERKIREEERKKAVVNLYSIGVAPESISAAFGITFAEVVECLVDFFKAHPTEPGHSS
ncbi:MAG: hypothetical protein LBU32_24555 [Clostridiales bacterium]|nr:hypothetical protein [Clostridiales bacterium]